MEKIRIVDSHTGGEPTRVVVSCPFQLNGSTMAEKCQQFNTHYDHYRSAIVCEPRGSDIMVGALLTEPVNQNCLAGVIFFNNVGTLGMCGHGLIGVAQTLKHLGKIQIGRYSVDTPVGTVHFETLADNSVRIENVNSYRFTKQHPLEIFPGTSERKTIHGDIAWGGNWFFICEDHGEPIEFSNLDRLQRVAQEIRQQIDKQQVTGRDSQLIDHIELIALSKDRNRSDAKNFVLCPGAAYDRSPCGTGTSAKLACLAADEKLQPGTVHRQESIVGSVFLGSFTWADAETSHPRQILPSIIGSAHITGEAELMLDSSDPFCWGLVAQ